RRTASREREDLHGAVDHGLGPPASPRLARVERRARQGPGNRGPSPSAAGVPSARWPASVSLEPPALPRRGEPPLGTGDLARLPRDAPNRAPLAPRARPTEVVPRYRLPAGPTVPRRGDAGVDSQAGSREPAVGLPADPRGT